MNIDDLFALAKSRGFFWQSAEIYGGQAGMYDYGHLGTLLKRNFEEAWLSFFVGTNDNYCQIEGSTILPEKPLIFSGHAARFNDAIISCTKCHAYYRADVLLSDAKVEVSEGATTEEIDGIVEKEKVRCPKCKGQLSKSKPFNMMMDLYLGPEKTDKSYLRPETAQSAYLNFFMEFNIRRKSLPMGIAIVGKAYRNEISPRQGLYRMREFTQAELQIFFDPESWEVDHGYLGDPEVNVVTYSKKVMERKRVSELVKDNTVPDFYAYHMALIHAFYTKALGVPEERFRFLEKGGEDKAFYNKIHMDIEINVESWGDFKEVGGLHYRGDYDLTSHTKGSMQDLSVSVNGKKLMPNVLELSFGVDRNVWMLMDVFYRKEGERSILKLPAIMSPYKAAVFSLQKDEKLDEARMKLCGELKQQHFKIFTDESGSIGRRYARMDEVGTPYCITIDFDTVNKDHKDYNTVTVRNRDDKTQIRMDIGKVAQFLNEKTEFNPFELIKA
jgi:glycyl-tRNA synthetase